MTPKSSTRGLRSVLIQPPTEAEIELFARALNVKFFHYKRMGEGGIQRRITLDNRIVRKEFRQLVQAWRDSGPNVQKLFAANPALAGKVRPFRGLLVPTNLSYGRLSHSAGPTTSNPRDPKGLAIRHFQYFLLNPFNEMLCGPCKYCDHYFVRRSNRRRVYCSKKCGLKDTSNSAIQRRRQRQHDEMLLRARKAIEEWAATRRTKDWKDWVAARTQISKRWLTRSVNAGIISMPINRTKQPDK